jgi:hypothetical protein
VLTEVTTIVQCERENAVVVIERERDAGESFRQRAGERPQLVGIRRFYSRVGYRHPVRSGRRDIRPSAQPLKSVGSAHSSLSRRHSPMVMPRPASAPTQARPNRIW